MQLNNMSLRVLVKGRAIKEHLSPLDHQTYVEGREGSEFEVELRNDNPFDVEAIVSIDGLSILDGKPAGDQSAGYVIPARKTVSIPGWKVDGDTAAKFTFSGARGGSYVDKIGGDALNKGVIGLMVYAPRHKPYEPYHGLLRSRGLLSSGYPKGMVGNAAWSSSAPSYNNGALLSASCATTPVGSVNEIAVAQTLGTDFGEATEFATKETTFERGDMHVMMALYYDDAQGLRKRGIDPRRSKTLPTPFPADTVAKTSGCEVPQGWTKEGTMATLVVTIHDGVSNRLDVIADTIRLRGITVQQVLSGLNVIQCIVKEKNVAEAIRRIEEIDGVKDVTRETTMETL